MKNQLKEEVRKKLDKCLAKELALVINLSRKSQQSCWTKKRETTKSTRNPSIKKMKVGFIHR